MKLIRIFLAGIISLLLVPGAKAQQVLTLEQAIDLGLKNNFDIRLARNDAAVAANDNAYANFAFAPRLNGTASKTWTNTGTKQEFGNGTKRDTSGIKNRQAQAALNLNWTLFDGFKMFATRQRIQAIEILGEMGVKNQLENTIAAIINGYYNIAQQKQQLRALAEQMSISEERVKLSDAKFQTGLGPKTDWLQAKVDYNAQRAMWLRQQTTIEQSKASLNQLLAIADESTNYDVLDTIPVNLSLSFGEIQENLYQTNPQLQMAKQNVEISRLALKEAKGDFFPILSFNSAYNFSQSRANAAVNQFSPVFNQNKGFNYGFSATVPIFNGLNVHRQVKAAKLDIQYQQLSLDNQQSQVNLFLRNAFKDYEYYKMSLTLEEESVDLARENVMVALERFRQGVSTTLELKEAQQSLELAAYRLIQARYNTKISETELMRLKGTLLK
ncbi:TolC family protein [Chitinophaga sp. SYP-B3965]|uniref:TolC family protein n=1 Tax=Chitinophaga sp. SYP-B3965 TaxID=2663120 RepID=UPI001299A2E7|nr:TolC family protein [Chitinophaga sp. SYP-B3965]MRG47631.1 TolC family protein [Chitinophaga sp. SYP-B3965]